MSFFDRVRKNAVVFGRRSREKFQSFTETTRLRSLLAGEEKYYKKLCTEIGDQYVRLHKEDYSPDFQELMTLANESRNRAEGYRSQIHSLRKVRVCPNCGAEIPQDYAFCTYCGAQLPAVELPVPKGYVKCPGCQAVIPDTVAFCNFCGTEQLAHIQQVQLLPDPEGSQDDISSDASAEQQTSRDQEPSCEAEAPAEAVADTQEESASQA